MKKLIVLVSILTPALILTSSVLASNWDDDQNWEEETPQTNITNSNNNSNENSNSNVNKNNIDIEIENNPEQNQNVTIENVVTETFTERFVPAVQPETGMPLASYAVMLGAIPLGLKLRNWGKKA